MSSIHINFSEELESLILDGYREKHGRDLDRDRTIQYFYVPEYIKLGKKVRRRKAISKFFDNWGVAIFWGVAILIFVGWSSFNSSNSDNDSTSPSSYSSDTSTIEYSDTCPITTCQDGACSSSTGRGTCSHHGGVAY